MTDLVSLKSAILQEIEGDAAPLGAPPSKDDFDSPSNKLRDAYRAALSAEKLGETADSYWQEATDWAVDLLQNHHKDIRTLAMLTQSLARIDGAAGIACGYELATEFASSWWDALVVNWQGDVSGNLKAFHDLDSSLIRPLRRLSISSDGYSVWQVVRSESLEKVSEPEEREQRIQQGDIEKIEITRSVKDTPSQFYKSLVADLERCKLAIENLTDVYHKKLDLIEKTEALPGTSQVKEELESILNRVRDIAAEKLAEDVPTDEDPDRTAGQEASSSVGSNHVGEAKSRDQALKLMETAAQWFERNEPQSPLPPMIRWVCEKGRLSSQEFFAILVQDDEERRLLSLMLGMNQEGDGDFDSSG